MNSKFLDYTLLTLVIIGAINWGLIGFFRFDLVAFLFGNMSWLSRIVYAFVGIGGLYLLSVYGRIRSMDAAGKIKIQAKNPAHFPLTGNRCKTN
jgi:hypothetical protein